MILGSGMVPFLTEEEDNPFLAIKLKPLEDCLIFHIEIKPALANLMKGPMNQFDAVDSSMNKDFYLFW